MSVVSKRVAPALAAVTVALLGVPLAQASPQPTGDQARVVDGHVDDWTGSTARVGGAIEYDAGEFIYQGYLFDDTGATATGQRPPQHGSFDGRSMGTFRYPTDSDRFADNVADLFELRIATSPSDVFGLIRLEAYRDTTTTVAAIAVDTDGDLTDSAGVWPRSAGLATPGADVVITVWGTGGEITDLATGAAVPIEVAASSDDADNAIEFRVPRGLMPGSSWRMWAATGLWDGAGWQVVPSGNPTATTPGYGSTDLPRAFNVAFRPDETGSYYEDAQAAALTAGDITSFVATVDVDALDSGEARPYEFEPGRFVQVVVEQSFTIGPLHEGESYTGVPGRFAGVGGAALNQTFDFFGRWQPYTLYLPLDWDGTTPHPVLLTLHGLGGSHNGFQVYDSFRDQVLEAPGFDSLVMVSPLGRGTSFYADYGEADVLEQLADAEARFPIDVERRYLVGYSMGGYGTYRLATSHPDMWAAAGTYAGYTGEFVGSYQPSSEDYDELAASDPTGLVAAVRGNVTVNDGSRGQTNTGNPLSLMTNLREVPVLHAAGSNDEIVPTSGQLRMRQVMDELDFRHRFDLYPGFEHLSFALLDDWAGMRKWFGEQRNVAAPRQVTYRFTPALNDPALVAEGIDLGLRYDSAYWASGLVRRTGPTDPTLDIYTYAAFDGESHAIAAKDHDVIDVLQPQTTIHPHIQMGDDWVETVDLPIDNRLSVTLTNLAAAVVDSTAAELVPSGLTVEIDADGPGALTVTGDFSGRIVDGGGTTITPGSSGLLIGIPEAGRFVVMVDEAPPPVVPEFPFGPVAALVALGFVLAVGRLSARSGGPRRPLGRARAGWRSRS